MHIDRKRTQHGSLPTFPPALESSHARTAEGAESGTEESSASSLTPDDPHNGRVHSGLSGDDGQYQLVDGAATPASLQPGHTADLGKAQDTSYDPMPSPAEAYANTGQANTEPQRDAPADNGDPRGVGPAEHGSGRATNRAKGHVRGSFRGG